MANVREQKAEDIVVLRGLEAVWQNPARFIGDVSTRGLHHLVDELVANSIDEAMNGHCTRIDVVLHANNVIAVTDNGRGIPVEMHPTEKKTALEVVLTTMDAGGKMKKGAYDYSGGLHGVGLSLVNALSEYLEVEVKRNGKKYFQRYENGKPVQALKTMGKTDKQGTSITFKPNEKFFGKTKFKSAILSNKLRELAYINKGLYIVFKEEGAEEDLYYFPLGLKDLIEEMNEGRSVVPREAVVFSGEIVPEDNDKERLMIEVGWQYNDTTFEKARAFTNSIHNAEGGTHEAGFKSGFAKAVNDYNEKKFKQQRLDSDYIREGLTSMICVRVKRPEFESQTKTKLTNVWIRNAVHKFVSEKMTEYMESNTSAAKDICDRAMIAFKASEAAKRARTLVRRKGLLDKLTAIPGKVADCEVKDASRAEVFIVEGDSAGGSAKQARDRRTQAVLPLKGKILNVEKKNIDEILKNEEIQTLIQVLGCGIDTSFDISKLRYNKVVIMTDADSDGSHIRILLLTFFYRAMPELIKRGNIYIAQPPLYRISYGKKHEYIKNDTELYAFLLKIIEKDCIVATSEGKTFKGKELAAFIASLIEYQNAYRFVEKSSEKLIIDYILRSTSIRKESLWEEKSQSLLKRELQSYLPIMSSLYPSINPVGVEFGKNDDDGSVIFTFLSERRGRRLRTIFDDEFMKSPEFSEMDRLSKKLKTLGDPPYYIELIDKGKAVSAVDVFDLLLKLIEVAKAKIDIQRYKGLGEMNPDQLWETTMDPKTRNVLKVDMDDEEAADDLTSILMGEGVSARKHFIDVNALNVRNLDV
jgi:DNA gyrase subunit B